MLTKIVFLISIFGTVSLWAHSADFWTGLENDFIDIEMQYQMNAAVKSRYPRVLRKTLEGLWGWHPGTTWDKESRCSLAELKSALVSEIELRKNQATLASFIERCSPTYSTSNIMNTLKILSQKGTFYNHPFFKYSFLNFPKGLKTRALWGIKSPTKRDLIIVRPGVYANVDELIAERYILYMLTELNDYHVVILENSTGGDHFVNNDHGAVGGPKEAFENLYLIDQIRKHPKLSGLVDKIHMMGISLGANGVLLSSLINQKEKRRYFDKTLLFCPVVDLRASFQAQMVNGVRPFLIDMWSSHRFQDLLGKKDFHLESFWDSLFSLSPRWVKSAWVWFEKKYRFHPEWQTYLSKDYYTGDFEKDYQFFNNVTRLPDNVYVVATKTDPIVFPEQNFDRLQQLAHENTFFYKFDDGFHCSMAYAYQWKFLDTLFAGMIGSSGDPVLATKRYQLSMHKTAHPDAEAPGEEKIGEIRSVEVAKMDGEVVELLVYFAVSDKVRSGHVKIPLVDLFLDAHHVDYDHEVVVNYIKRFVQTKFEVQKENSEFFIKI
jgi:hypothetical protein